MNLILNENIDPGFESNVFDSQLSFRLIMDAMARPGVKKELNLNLTPPKNLFGTTAAAILSLLDPDTSFYLSQDDKNIEDWIRFHCGSKPGESKDLTSFAIILDSYDLDIEEFSYGTFPRPDLSTTFIIQTENIEEAERENSLILTGPGIKESRCVKIEGINKKILMARKKFVFPLGADFIFTDQKGFLAIPRTTIIKGL